MLCIHNVVIIILKGGGGGEGIKFGGRQKTKTGRHL